MAPGHGPGQGQELDLMPVGHFHLSIFCDAVTALFISKHLIAVSFTITIHNLQRDLNCLFYTDVEVNFFY